MTKSDMPALGALLVVNLYYGTPDPASAAAYHAQRLGSMARGLVLIQVISTAAKSCRVKRRPELDQGHICAPLRPAGRSTDFYLPVSAIGISARVVRDVDEATCLDAAWRATASQMLEASRRVCDLSKAFWTGHWAPPPAAGVLL